MQPRAGEEVFMRKQPREENPQGALAKAHVHGCQIAELKKKLNMGHIIKV